MRARIRTHTQAHTQKERERARERESERERKYYLLPLPVQLVKQILLPRTHARARARTHTHTQTRVSNRRQDTRSKVSPPREATGLMLHHLKAHLTTTAPPPSDMTACSRPHTGRARYGLSCELKLGLLLPPPAKTQRHICALRAGTHRRTSTHAHAVQDANVTIRHTWKTAPPTPPSARANTCQMLARPASTAIAQTYTPTQNQSRTAATSHNLAVQNPHNPIPPRAKPLANRDSSAT